MKHAGYKNSLPIKSSLFFFFCVFIALRADLSAQSDFNVLDDWLRYSDAENSLYHHMTDQAFHMLEKRSVEITSLHTPQDWRQRIPRRFSCRPSRFPSVPSTPMSWPKRLASTGAAFGSWMESS